MRTGVRNMEVGLQRTFVGDEIIPVRVKEFLDEADEFSLLMMRYNCAIREVRTKLEVLNDELSVVGQHNPIEAIKSRVKKSESIADKLMRKGKPLTVESIETNLNDVAGVRVICSFMDDIYQVARMLAVQDDITVLEVKDYIKHPKSNGYRSYHMIVEIPVFFSDVKRSMRVEIQIRTIAMDFWSTLEHQVRYKKAIPNTEFIVGRLKECSDTIAQTDREMMEIRNYLQGS